MVLPVDLVLLVVMVLSRPPGLARCLGLDFWDDRYLKGNFLPCRVFLCPIWAHLWHESLRDHWLMSLAPVNGAIWCQCTQKVKPPGEGTSDRKKIWCANDVRQVIIWREGIDAQCMS